MNKYQWIRIAAARRARHARGPGATALLPRPALPSRAAPPASALTESETRFLQRLREAGL